ncbi:MAG: penicillin-binding protein 2 [Acidimicrobiia bacterium]
MADVPRLRLGVLGIVIVSLFAVLLGRLWYLQILTAPDASAVATVNIKRTVQLTPTRGRILDRNGVVLADNKASTVITVDRKVIVKKKDRTQLFERVAAVIEPDPAKVADKAKAFESRYNDERYQELEALPVAENVTDRQAIYLRERVEDFPGLDVREQQVRTYPYGNLASHIIGYVGRIPKENKELYTKRAEPRYQPSDIVGVAGIELLFEDDLRGVPGQVVYEVDATNRVIRKTSEVAPQSGRDVVLTIDAKTQQLAEQALQAELEYRRTQSPSLSAEQQALGLSVADTFKAPAGSVVVQDPNNGDIIAMASNPSFDLRELSSGITRDRSAILNCPKETADAGLCDPEAAPLLNRAVQGKYAPGSTFKLVTSMAMIATGLHPSDYIIEDEGSFQLPKCEEGEKCKWSNAGGAKYGDVNVIRALTVSSDVFYYNLGYEFFKDQGIYGLAIQDMAERLGFGQASGVQLPFESPGFVPTPARKKARHDDNPSAYPTGFYPIGDNVNLAVGQGDMLATPLQLANAYSTFANEGFVNSPNIVEKVTAPRTVDTELGETVRVIGQRTLRDKLAMPDAVRDPIMLGLVGVTKAGDGTAHKTFDGFPLDTTPVAGKTGTAQTGAKQLDKDDTSLFVAFAPAFAPKYTVSVVMEKSGFGAQAAAPVARLMFESLLGVGSCKPADLVPLPEFDPAAPVERAGLLPDGCVLSTNTGEND